MFGNLHIFVNSVDFIISVIKELNLKPEQVKIVCSSNKNDVKGKISNHKKLGETFSIEKPLSPVKKINFYTSSCFEGCDIFDNQGKVYIVSDSNKKHTLLDISTLLIQICGRIRDTRYKKVTHIFSYSRYKTGISFEEFKEKTLSDYERSKKMIDEINNNLSDDTRKLMINGIMDCCNDKYTHIIENKLYIDKNLLNVDMINFKITTGEGIYSSRIAYVQELEKNNINHEYNRYDYFKSADRLKENKKTKLSFKNYFEDYVQLQNNKSGFYILNEEINLIDTEKPLVGEVYYKLGVDKVRELKYHTGNIKTELIKPVVH